MQARYTKRENWRTLCTRKDKLSGFNSGPLGALHASHQWNVIKRFLKRERKNGEIKSESLVSLSTKTTIRSRNTVKRKDGPFQSSITSATESAPLTKSMVSQECHMLL